MAAPNELDLMHAAIDELHQEVRALRAQLDALKEYEKKSGQ